MTSRERPRARAALVACLRASSAARAAAVLLPPPGRSPVPCMQLQQRRELHAELERIEAEQQAPPTLPGTAPIQLPGRFDSWFSRLMLFVYKRVLCLHLSVAKKKQVLEDTDEARRQLVLEKSREPDGTTGSAVIIFDNVASVANMLHEHNWCNRVGSMLFPPGWGRAFNIATRGVFARTPKITLTVTQGNRMQSVRRHVSVRRAPEPSDVRPPLPPPFSTHRDRALFAPLRFQELSTTTC